MRYDHSLHSCHLPTWPHILSHQSYQIDPHLHGLDLPVGTALTHIQSSKWHWNLFSLISLHLLATLHSTARSHWLTHTALLMDWLLAYSNLSNQKTNFSFTARLTHPRFSNRISWLTPATTQQMPCCKTWHCDPQLESWRWLSSHVPNIDHLAARLLVFTKMSSMSCLSLTFVEFIWKSVPNLEKTTRKNNHFMCIE